MAFVKGFKKLMGMSPLDDELDDEMDDGVDTEEQDDYHYSRNSHSYDDINTTPNMSSGSMNSMDSYNSADAITGMGLGNSYAREETGNVVNFNQSGQAQVVLVKPERFEDASAIADHLQSKRTIIVNTDSVSPDVRRRLIDFLSGVAYADGGTIKKASNTTFVMTPSNVGVMGESVPEESEQDTNGGIYY